LAVSNACRACNAIVRAVTGGTTPLSAALVHSLLAGAEAAVAAHASSTAYSRAATDLLVMLVERSGCAAAVARSSSWRPVVAMFVAGGGGGGGGSVWSGLNADGREGVCTAIASLCARPEIGAALRLALSGVGAQGAVQAWLRDLQAKSSSNSSRHQAARRAIAEMEAGR